MKKCHACREGWEGSPGTQPGHQETCTHCGADLHVCLNCRLYDPAASHQCQSPTIEPVRDKARGNYCDEFEFSPKGTAGPEGDRGSQDEMKRKWDDFFK
jgi:hypothetical protein